MHPVAGRVISIMAFSVCSVPVNQTLNENRSRIKARLPGVDWNPSPTTMRAPVILLARHIRLTPRGRLEHSTSTVMIDSVIILLMVPILVTPVPTSLTLWGRSRAVSRLDCACNYGSAVNPISRRRYYCILLSCCPEQGPDLR